MEGPYRRTLLNPFKGDPDTLVGSIAVAYGRPRPYLLPDGRQVAYTREPAWTDEGVPLAHLPLPDGRPTADRPPLQKLVLHRVSASEYDEHGLADPDRCEPFLRLWGRSYGLDFARIEDLLALAEAFPPPASLWRELGTAPSTPRRIVAPGTWQFGSDSRHGKDTVPERLFPALAAKGRFRNDPDPRRAALHSLPATEAFGFKARFHYTLFVERKPTLVPPP